MGKISDKTKVFLVAGLLEGLKRDLERRLLKCPDCKWTLEYINYTLNFIDDLNNEVNND